MKTVYVIAVKHLFDYKGNTLNRWEYVQFGECGYTFFTESVNGARHFYSIDKAMNLSFMEIVKVSMIQSLFVLRALFSETLL